MAGRRGGNQVTRWNIVIDIEKCEDCNNCFLACKDEHVDNDWPGYTDAQPRHGHRWMNILRKERGQFPLIDVAYRPTPCMHCDHAACIAAAGAGAVYKRDDGIVLIDPEKAKGRKELVKSCPYGAIWWNDEKKVPQKCTLCAHLLDDGWKQPRCVQACPTGALRILKVDDNTMQRSVESQGLEILLPALRARPRVYYKNLHRFERCFIAGSAAVKSSGTIDCAQGVRVVLTRNGLPVTETLTDNYGDFKFDNLEPGSGVYRLDAAFEDFEAQTVAIELTESVTLEDIVFE
jgi:Fe-S-cluster-containing dehydrogenase component